MCLSTTDLSSSSRILIKYMVPPTTITASMSRRSLRSNVTSRMTRFQYHHSSFKISSVKTSTLWWMYISHQSKRMLFPTLSSTLCKPSKRSALQTTTWQMCSSQTYSIIWLPMTSFTRTFRGYHTATTTSSDGKPWRLSIIWSKTSTLHSHYFTYHLSIVKVESVPWRRCWWRSTVTRATSKVSSSRIRISEKTVFKCYVRWLRSGHRLWRYLT